VISRSRLNERQREAVEHEGGPLVVFAGAGSGKTMVITHRVSRLIAEGAVPPWRILAVTFTNKAAGEMRDRLDLLLPAGAGDLWVGTFHATCARLLRSHHADCGVRRDFVIYDDSDQRAVLARLIRERELDSAAFTPERLAYRINRAKQEGIGPDEYQPAGERDRITRQLFVEYQERLRQAGALDFGDLIFRLTRAMSENEPLRDALRERFDHVLVDEFQDTNHVQFRFVSELSAVHRNLCVVGDDDQSIYRWRGADRRNILDFRKHFPDARLIKLEQNYRSTRRILRVANAVVTHNIDREPKTLWTENEEGLPVTAVCCDDERHEAWVFVETIREFLAGGASRSDVALLYRIHAQSRVFEEALRAANIPYRVVGGIRFYDRAEVKDVLAYLRAVHNPDDDVSLLRVINTPPRGIGKTTIDRLTAGATRAGSSVWRAVCRVREGGAFGTAARKKLARFRDLVGELRAAASGGATPAELTAEVMRLTGYRDRLVQADHAEADAKLENLRELEESMLEFERLAEEATLGAFLELVTLQTDTDRESDESLVTLMTVHAAKGLEFPLVVVAGVEEGRFPLLRADEGEGIDELEEERRLAYVAFTRARQRLLLTFAQSRFVYGERQPCERSRFIGEIPPGELNLVGPRRARPDRLAGDPDGRPRYRQGHPSEYPSARSRTVDIEGDSRVDRLEGSDLCGVALGPGARVRHARFGVGSVIEVRPGSRPTVVVRFPGYGNKTIVTQYLEPV
jgi:DNA helicase-2/ATP-dependent DNA helicase PcrA